jgi:peroxiredoxin
MRLNIGDTAPLINLPELKGNQFQSVNPNNRVTLIAFHRFAGCPFCNLRLHQLIQRHVAWKDRLDVIVIKRMQLTISRRFPYWLINRISLIEHMGLNTPGLA